MSPEYFAVHAQGGVPAIGGGPLSARPAASQTGRLYVSNEGAIYKDNGAEWLALSGDDAASILTKLLTVDTDTSGLNATTLQGTTLAALVTEAEHTKAAHDALLIDASTIGGTTLAALVTEAEHTKALHDALLINAAAHKATHEPGGTDPMTVNAAAGTASLRTLGTSATSAAAGNDSRLSDTRTPTAHQATHASGGTDSLSGLYAAINDARLRVIRDEGVALTNRAILDFIGTGVIVEDDAATGRTKVTVSGAAAGLASETAAGIVEIATAAEIQAGTAGVLVPDAAKLAAEITRRLTPEAWITPTLLNGWVNFGAPRESLSFRKTTSGDVVIRGNVKSGASGTVVFTLPTGYRPANERLFPSISGGGGSPSANITVTSAGAVNASLGTGNNTQVTVEVRFDV